MTSSPKKRSCLACFLTSKVASMYFKDCTRTDVCKKRFIEKIEEDKELYSKLKEAGFIITNKYITPKQMEIIVEYWGAPSGYHLL